MLKSKLISRELLSFQPLVTNTQTQTFVIISISKTMCKNKKEAKKCLIKLVRLLNVNTKRKWNGINVPNEVNVRNSVSTDFDGMELQMV